MIELTKVTDLTKGHFSVKLRIKNLDGTETWEPYDTRLEESDPEVGTLLVFNSETGLYEEVSSLAEAKALIEVHTLRLTNVVIPETGINFHVPKRDLNTVIKSTEVTKVRSL